MSYNYIYNKEELVGGTMYYPLLLLLIILFDYTTFSIPYWLTNKYQHHLYDNMSFITTRSCTIYLSMILHLAIIVV